MAPETVPYVSLGVGLTAMLIGTLALLLAITIGIRSRTIFRARLTFSFRFIVSSGQPRRDRRKKPAALIIIPDERARVSDLQVPILICNDSKRPLTQVVVELVYPAAFYVSNRRLEELHDELAARFGEAEHSSVEAVKRFIASRVSSPQGNDVLVRYEVGPLQPGKPFGFYEPFLLPERDKAFDPGNDDSTAFANVMDKMRESKFLRAAMHLRAAVYADLTAPQRHEIDVVLSEKGISDNNREPLSDYVAAYWFGRYPEEHAFWRKPSRPWPYPRPVKFRIVDTIIPQRVVKVSERKDDNVAMAMSMNPLKSFYGGARIVLPGYNPRKLSKSITTSKDALLSIGWISLKRRRTRGADTTES